MRRLNQDLKEGSFLRAYLLYGNEEYLIRSYAERLEKAAANGDTMNVSVVSGHDLSAETLSDFTDAMPFMAEKRVLVVKDSGIFKSTPDAFVRWIEGLPATACVIFTESEADKRSRGFKAVEKIGYCCRLDHPDEETLGKWILSSLKKRGLSITKGAYQKLLLYLDGDMENAKNELEKLMDYAEGSAGITASDVDTIVTKRTEARVFELVEYVSAGKRNESMALYYDLLSLKEPPSRLLFLLERQFRQLLYVKEMQALRTPGPVIADSLGVRPFVISKLSAVERRFTAVELKEALRMLLEHEEAVKTGDLQPELAIELAIASLTA